MNFTPLVISFEQIKILMLMDNDIPKNAYRATMVFWCWVLLGPGSRYPTLKQVGTFNRYP